MRKNWICIMLLCMLMILPLRTSAVQIQMNVMEPDVRSTSVAVTDEHTWYIRCFFSGITANGSQYTVLQTLSPGLTLIPGSLEIHFLGPNGKIQHLAMEEDYSLTMGAVVEDGSIAERFLVSFTEEGHNHVSKGGEIRIAYRTMINESASVGTQLIGTAQLNVLDPGGNRSTYLSDKASIRTGGFHIHLMDEAGAPLTGGEFMLAREVSAGEANTELLETENKLIPVVYIPFCTSDDLSRKTTYTAKTTQGGNALCYGLHYGEYYLVQTEPGQGTVLPSKPIKVTVNEVSHLTAKDNWKTSSGETADYTVKVVNTTRPIPNTGDRGIYSCRAAGILVILCACLLMWYNSKGRILFR